MVILLFLYYIGKCKILTENGQLESTDRGILSTNEGYLKSVKFLSSHFWGIFHCFSISLLQTNDKTIYYENKYL